MRTWYRFAAILIAAAALLHFVGIHVIPSLSEIWNPRDRFGNPISLVGEYQKKIRLQREMARSLDRMEAKEKLVWHMLDGKLTLWETAASFEQVDRDVPPYIAPFLAYPGDSPEEKLCRHVIGWTATSVAHKCSTYEVAIIREKLEADLQEHLDRYDDIELPLPFRAEPLFNAE